MQNAPPADGCPGRGDHPGHGSIDPDEHRDAFEGTPIELRCQSGVACGEVVDRLRGADRSAAEGFDEIADELRRTAARFAELHAYGSDVERGLP
jgi:hypothetical protein